MTSTLNRLFLTISLLVAATSSLRAQCDSIAGQCERFITSNYISDGQSYRALLTANDIAEFQTTLFGGNIYRIAACTGGEEGSLLFRLYDEEKNMLFSNTDFGGALYWDFSLESTMTVTIEASLDPTRTSSGCAVLVIGFRK